MPKGLFIRIDEGLEREFDQVCREGGYKKGAVVQKMIQGFVKAKQREADPVKAAQEFGIDTTLLDENLKRTPTERLRDLERFHGFVEGIRKQRKKHDRV